MLRNMPSIETDFYETQFSLIDKNKDGLITVSEIGKYIDNHSISSVPVLSPNAIAHNIAFQKQQSHSNETLTLKFDKVMLCLPL